VSKPVNTAELRRALGGVTPAPCAPSEKLASQDAAGPCCDLKAALERVGGDEEFLNEVVALFRQDATRLLGEVRTAVAEGDAAGLRRAAHALKGSAGYVAARPTVEAARRLETIGAQGDLAKAASAFEDLEREFERLTSALPETAAQPVP
jgi:two-component system, sensor histidine kinase and response regulator